jgi:hypothetical protein
VRELHLPRAGRIARLLLPLDLLCVSWALVLHAHPARGPALALVGAAWLVFLALLIQSFAWVVVIAFFARGRAHEGTSAAWLLLLQLVCLVSVIWIAGPALKS